ncbi:hypothetical protein N7481_010405 [Penicillium waksmanii]|uniref:uncharacterized protein n=1 Tax=Penicillium waksmanii TaxID=69791 RepID=UPI0025466428|nr:uncharacterized protein N7481_010405 [Penicillium waksmanii]KAJ5973195.1 hypothetical protein N7481_010405 [Penicillium waksmanii]
MPPLKMEIVRDRHSKCCSRCVNWFGSPETAIGPMKDNCSSNLRGISEEMLVSLLGFAETDGDVID